MQYLRISFSILGCQSIQYLTIIRRRRGDYRGIFAEVEGQYSSIIAEPEANNSVSIFTQVFCVLGLNLF
jgi:hypothetical protein